MLNNEGACGSSSVFVIVVHHARSSAAQSLFLYGAPVEKSLSLKKNIPCNRTLKNSLQYNSDSLRNSQRKSEYKFRMGKFNYQYIFNGFPNGALIFHKSLLIFLIHQTGGPLRVIWSMTSNDHKWETALQTNDEGATIHIAANSIAACEEGFLKMAKGYACTQLNCDSTFLDLSLLLYLSIVNGNIIL